MKIEGKRLIKPEWSRVDPRGRSSFCIDCLLMELMPEQLSVLFILLDNNYDYKNKVQGYS